MKVPARMPWLTPALVLLALVMGTFFPGLLIADYGPPMAVRLLLFGIPFVLLPFIIGWNAPSFWWFASAGAILPLLFSMIALATAPPQTTAEALARWPLFLPLLLTFSFALLGKSLRQRR